MGNNDWLAALQVGDTVVVSGRWANHIAKVERMTPTQILAGKTRYCRRTGRQKGGNTWDSTWLRQPTQELLDEILRLKFAKRARETDWTKYSLDELRQIAALISEGR